MRGQMTISEDIIREHGLRENIHVWKIGISDEIKWMGYELSEVYKIRSQIAHLRFCDS